MTTLNCSLSKSFDAVFCNLNNLSCYAKKCAITLAIYFYFSLCHKCGDRNWNSLGAGGVEIAATAKHRRMKSTNAGYCYYTISYYNRRRIRFNRDIIVNALFAVSLNFGATFDSMTARCHRGVKMHFDNIQNECATKHVQLLVWWNAIWASVPAGCVYLKFVPVRMWTRIIYSTCCINYLVYRISMCFTYNKIKFKVSLLEIR